MRRQTTKNGTHKLIFKWEKISDEFYNEIMARMSQLRMTTIREYIRYLIREDNEKGKRERTEKRQQLRKKLGLA